MTEDSKQPIPAKSPAGEDVQPDLNRVDRVAEESVEPPAMAALINNTGDDTDGAPTG